MKLSTHVVTGVETATIITYTLGSRSLVDVTVVSVLAAVLQYFVDAVGHTPARVRGRIVPVRNMIHSLPGITILSLIVASTSYPVEGFNPHIYIGVYAAGLLHLVEDLVTEGGVYLFSRRRIKTPVTAGYDTPTLNYAVKTVFTIVYVLFLVENTTSINDALTFIVPTAIVIAKYKN